MGTGRSRTSAVAGILHKLGCSMGDQFVPSNENNPWGTFEDLELFNLTREYVSGRADKEEFIPLLKERAQQPVWGIKDPQLVVTARFLIPMLKSLGVEVKVVVCKRDARDTINSYMNAYKRGRNRSEQWYEEAIRNLAARLLEFDGETLEIDTDNLIANPEEYTKKLMNFSFDEPVSPKNYNSARTHIQKKPKRKVEGWGKIAVGLRVFKHPEVEFLLSWTKLLTGGLRNYDTVLMPQYYQPAHWAATNLAQQFMRTNFDSLLLVDDDMEFEIDDLHKLRENKENWEYDIVAPFCTKRGWPPRPINFKYAGEQQYPKKLRGELFDIDTDIKWGEVMPRDAVGLAFTLIRRRVFEAMIDEEWGLDYTYFFTYGQGLESDDIPFCRKARELGFRIGLDTTVDIGHVGNKVTGKKDFLQWQQQKEDQDMQLNVGLEDLRSILEEASKGQGSASRQARDLLGRING